MPLELPQILIFGMIGPDSASYQCLRQVLWGSIVGCKPIDNGKTGDEGDKYGFSCPLGLEISNDCKDNTQPDKPLKK